MIIMFAGYRVSLQLKPVSTWAYLTVTGLTSPVAKKETTKPYNSDGPVISKGD